MADMLKENLAKEPLVEKFIIILARLFNVRCQNRRIYVVGQAVAGVLALSPGISLIPIGLKYTKKQSGYSDKLDCELF